MHWVRFCCSIRVPGRGFPLIVGSPAGLAHTVSKHLPRSADGPDAPSVANERLVGAGSRILRGSRPSLRAACTMPGARRCLLGVHNDCGSVLHGSAVCDLVLSPRPSWRVPASNWVQHIHRADGRKASFQDIGAAAEGIPQGRCSSPPAVACLVTTETDSSAHDTRAGAS